MPRAGPLLSREITTVAEAVVEVLTQCGLSCCLFGSSACWYYGMRYRVPKVSQLLADSPPRRQNSDFIFALKDVDVVVMEDPDRYDPEDIKREIVERDANFYLIDSVVPTATYQVLWYRLPGPRSSNRRCKVDILLPGPEYLDIPHISDPYIHIDAGTGMQLVPFFTLLLLKLKGWSDHRADNRAWIRDKVPQDEDDLDELLHIAVNELAVRSEDEEHLWEDWFVETSIEWVQEHINEYPDAWPMWSQIFNL